MSSTMTVTIAQAEMMNVPGLLVSDTAANIAQGLASFPSLVNRVSSFTLSAAGIVTAAVAAQLAKLNGAFHLGGQTLTVQDSLANVTLAGNAAGVALASGVQVVDAAFNLLNAVSTRFAHVTSVMLTGSPILTAAQLTKLEALPHFSIASGSLVTLSDTVGAISTALSAHAGWFTPLTTISVHLDGSQIGAYTAGLLNSMISNGKHISFVASPGDATLNITAAAHDIAASAAALNGLAAHVPLAFTVTNPAASVNAVDAAALATLPSFVTHLAVLKVSDTAAAIDAHAAALFAHPLAGITVTSGAFSGNALQLLSPMLHFQGASTAVLSASTSGNASVVDALAALPGFSLAAGVQLTFADSYANIVASANAGGYAAANGISIFDTGANLATAAAHNWGTLTPSYILASDSAVNAAQLTALSGVQGAFSDTAYDLTLADTTGAVLGLSTHVANLADFIAITDVSSNVTTAALNLLTSHFETPITITLTDTGHVRVSAATYQADMDVIDDISYGKTPILKADTSNVILNSSPGLGAVIVTGSSADILGVASLLNEDWHVGSAAITDSVAALTSTVFDQLENTLATPLTITLSDPNDTLSVTAAIYAADTAVVDALQNAATLLVTGNAADLGGSAARLATDYHVTSVQLTDTAAAFDSQSTILAPLAAKLVITLTTDGAIGVPGLALLAASKTYFLDGPIGDVTLVGSVAGVNGLSTRALAIPVSIVISDVAASLTSSALDTLQNTVSGKLGGITLTDNGLVGVSAATYAADRTVIDKITNTGLVTVTGTTSAIDGLAAMLKADAAVGSIAVSDTAADVVGHIANLLNVGSKLSVTLTDTLPIAVGLAPSLALLPVTNVAHLVIADTGTNIATVVEAASPATLGLLTAASVKLSGNSVVVAADAKALEGLSSFSNAGFKLVIWDTVAHLISGLYTTTIANSDVSALYLQTNGSPVTLSAANVLTMLALRNFHDTNPDGSANLITISDTAAHLSAAFTTLQADALTLGHVSFVVNASATVSEAMLGQLQALHATAGSGVALTARDTGTLIAADIASQGTQTITPSISASAYTLSGNGVVTLNDAAALGAQSSFTPGPYTLTVKLTADTSIGSVARANALGNLGSALVVTGGHVTVAGSVAQLQGIWNPIIPQLQTGLTHAALAVVTPLITDSFGNIVSPLGGLSSASPLLGGTLTVSDAESISALQAQAFFGLIKTGSSGSGVAAANVSFGMNVEAVTGSIADLQTLTMLPAWSQSTALTPAFTLTAADSVANLIAAGNTSFLAGLTASGVSAGSVTDAASAEHLFALQTQIHYSPSASSLTITDSAANLLNPNNADGLALANVITLAEDDTATAAGAETLLSNGKFDLTHVLTIMDTPQNLLDATLGHLLTLGGYGSAVVVELSAPTITDASTAAALVKLPGFADPSHDLTISDHPSFLIDSTYLPAELAATLVTIPGDETVSAATVLRLSEVPHFNAGINYLILAANDVADDATLAAIGDLGSSYQPNGHTITMTQDDTSLTQSEFAALQNDNVVTNGHMFSAVYPAITISDYFQISDDTLIAFNTQIEPAAGYDAHGTSIALTPASNADNNAEFIFADGPANFSFTETINGAVSAPVIVLDTASLAGAIGAGSFSTVFDPNAVHFSIGSGPNNYLPVYTAGSVPAFTVPALVYDPVQQTVSLETQNGSPVLITLGGSFHPATLASAEFSVKTYQS